MVEAWIRVGGQWGLNGHESARLAVGAARFASDIVCMANGRSVNAKNVMAVMSLQVRPRTSLRILAAGPDEIAALEALSAILGTQESRDRPMGNRACAPADCLRIGPFSIKHT